MTDDAVEAPDPHPGSFRDPLSRVFSDGEAVWRGLTADALADFDALAASAFFATAIASGDLVGTERAPESDVLGDEWAAVLRHEHIDVISYPYEWSFEMLRDAARLQLRLTRSALADRLITKDASPYNVQFVGTKPVFIDVGSFERLRAGEPWPGYRQFCELFLNPLLVRSLSGVPFQPLLRGRVDGITPETAAGMLRGRAAAARGVLTHVKLHARTERRYRDAGSERDVKRELSRAGFGPRLIDAQLRNLERTVERHDWKAATSTWSEYGDRSHYAERDLSAKDAFVAASVGTVPRPRRVLDLGANDGRFSQVALDAGAESVVAVDSDELVVDRLYRKLRADDEQRILPLVVDLADPSPALGWRSRERASFAERVHPDLVLCLAVVHHLALPNMVPLEEIVAFLADFGAPVVVEFPHPEDPMATRLLNRKREGVFDTYNRQHWEQALGARFAVTATETLPSGTRTLYRCQPR